MSQQYSHINLAIVVSSFNREVTQLLLSGAKARLAELAIVDEQVNITHVPGAIEIPLMAQRLAKTHKFDAIIALGAVIKGETDHYTHVCDYLTQGCLQISLAQDIPIIFGVLTTQNAQQAFDRVGGAHGHKGREAIDSALAMALLTTS